MLVSSRDRVLPGEDADAAQVIDDVFRRRGMTVMARSRAVSAVRDGDGVLVTLADGREVREDREIERQDFVVTTSNKQLNFLQHICTILAIHGRAAVL